MSALAAPLAAGWAVVAMAFVVRARPPSLPRPIIDEPRATRHITLPPPRTLAVLGVAVVVCAAVFPPLALAVLTVVAVRPPLMRRRARVASAIAVERDVADVVTLVGLAVSAGHNLVGGLRAACARGTGPVSAAIRTSLARVERGERLADALESLPGQLGEAVRPLVSALVSCDRYGAPLASTLDRLAADVRIASRQRAEAAARRLPVRLLFPLVTCILPAFALLTVAPLIAGSFRGLRL